MKIKSNFFLLRSKLFVSILFLVLLNTISFAATPFYKWNPGTTFGSPDQTAIAEMANWRCLTVGRWDIVERNTTNQWYRTDLGNWPWLAWTSRNAYSLQHQMARYPDAIPENKQGDWMLIPVNIEPNRFLRVKMDIWREHLLLGAESFEIRIVKVSPNDNITYLGNPLIANYNFKDPNITTFVSDIVPTDDFVDKNDGLITYLGIRALNNDPDPWRINFSNIVMEYINEFTIDNIIEPHPATENNGSGTIDPAGQQKVFEEKDYSYTITANHCSQIARILLDGDSIIVPSSPTSHTGLLENISANHKIAVMFIKTKYKMNYTASAGAKITPNPNIATGDNVECGSSLKYTFEIENGYEFDSLIVDGTTYTAPRSDYSFTNIEANHDIKLIAKLKKYKITASAEQGGTISPLEATVSHGQDQAFTITPNANYSIRAVYIDNLPIELNTLENNKYTFKKVSANHTINVSFIHDAENTLEVQTSTGGTVKKQQISQKEYTVTATAEQCYAFVNWTNLKGDELSTNPTLSITLQSDSIVKANFEPIKTKYTVTVKSANEAQGTVEANAADNVDCGTKLSIKAIPATNHAFINWTDQNGNILYFAKQGSSTPTAYMPEAEITITSDMTITANFAYSISLSLAVNPANTPVTLSGAGTYVINQKVKYSASEVAGYRFLNWTDANTAEVVSNSLADSITLDKAYSLIANFEKVHNLIVKSSIEDAATLTGTGSYKEGTYAKFSANPKREFVFLGWTKEEVTKDEDGNVIDIKWVKISSNLNDSILMDKNYELTANFDHAAPVTPIVNTLQATDISGITAILNGDIIDIGLPTGTAWGFEYSTNTGFSAGTTVLATGNIAVGKYNAIVARLSPNTTYYFKAFIESASKRYYGEEMNFTTIGATMSDPIITTNAATDVKDTSATLNGNISHLGWPTATSSGFTYSKTSNFEESTEIVVADANSEVNLGDFTANVATLTENTTYYYKAWVNVEDKRFEGETKSFTTSPTVIYTEGNLEDKIIVSNIQINSATFSGTLLSDGGTTENAELGFVYSKTQNPTITNATKLKSNNTNLGSYSITATDLTSLTDYYVRGFYTNNIGTVYTSEVKFTTPGVGIDEIIKNTTINLYPNPANELTTLSFDLEKDCNMKITLRDLSGKEVFSVFNGFAIAGVFNKDIETANLTAGTYFLHIKIAENSTFKELIIK